MIWADCWKPGQVLRIICDGLVFCPRKSSNIPSRFMMLKPTWAVVWFLTSPLPDIDWPPPGQLALIFAKLLYIDMSQLPSDSFPEDKLQELFQKVKGHVERWIELAGLWEQMSLSIVPFSFFFFFGSLTAPFRLPSKHSAWNRRQNIKIIDSDKIKKEPWVK